MNLRRIFFNLTHWESWHYQIKYIPIAPLWLWYCIKARSFWFFSTSNPTITFGGFEGEGKTEIYEQLPYGSYPKTLYVTADEPFETLYQKKEENGFKYPFIVKPDVGSMGYMFRKIHTEYEWKLYHEYMTYDYIIQEFVDYHLEASVFYYRMPNEKKGRITGFLIKTPPVVTGDGKSTLEQLIEANYDLRFKVDEMRQKHKNKLKRVLAVNETFILSHACNRSQGGKLVNIAHEIDENLTAVFDKISNYSGHFFYGRWDLKCASVESLKRGKEFSILEYNGAGAGIQHVYGNGLNLWQACKTIAKHWNILYRISAYNHKVKGIPYYGFANGRKILKESMKQLRHLEKLDDAFKSEL